MYPGLQPPRRVRVAVVDADACFASVAASGLRFDDALEVVAIAPAPIDLVERVTAWQADVVVLDAHVHGPDTGRPLVGELKGLGMDVVLVTDDPAPTILDGCPVHDRGRPRAALYAIVEAFRRRRQPTDVEVD